MGTRVNTGQIISTELGSRYQSKATKSTKTQKRTNAALERLEEARRKEITLETEYKIPKIQQKIELCGRCLMTVIFRNNGFEKCYRCGHKGFNLIYDLRGTN